MAPYGSMWLHVAPCGSMWLHVAPYGSIWLHMAPYGSIWLHVAPCGSMWLHMAPCGSIWLHVAPYGSIWLHVAPYGSWTLGDEFAELEKKHLKAQLPFEATSFVRSLAESGSLQEEETNPSFGIICAVHRCVFVCVCVLVFICCRQWRHRMAGSSRPFKTKDYTTCCCNVMKP